MKERNYLVKHALFRKAGKHQKTNKALRIKEKRSTEKSAKDVCNDTSNN